MSPSSPSPSPSPRLRSRPGLRRTGALAVVLALATGCGANASDGGDGGDKAETRVFTADNGEIEIPKDPKRVVATGYAVPALIEADAELVGISGWRRGESLMTDEDLATYKKLKKVAGETAAETNYEAIANAKPDLIVIGVPTPVLSDIDVERLESLAPVVAIGPTQPHAWRTLSQRQADAAGRLDNFAEAKATYEAKAKKLKAKYADPLKGLDFGHVGAYTDSGKGSFQREFSGSWGTNIAEDAGVSYYGEVKKKRGGSHDVSETPSIEELPESLGDADAITYTVEADGKPAANVQYVLDSKLWKELPAVKKGNVFPLRYTEAATYASATTALESVDKALAPLLDR